MNCLFKFASPLITFPRADKLQLIDFAYYNRFPLFIKLSLSFSHSLRSG